LNARLFTERLAGFERLEGRRSARRRATDVRKTLVVVGVAEVGAVLVVEIDVDLGHADRLPLPGGNDSVGDELAPVV
jgi:hypothetical protein